MTRISAPSTDAIPQQQRNARVALVGNPNTGKSTLFNALAGMRQRVGNYPGVTVEKKTGKTTCGEWGVELVDLPGTYSLAPRSPDEMVTVDVLLARRSDEPPLDAVVCILDASNLERNLYLVSQVRELGLPLILALNMTDVARSRGIELEVNELAKRLGAPVVELVAHRKQGLERLRAVIGEVLSGATPKKPASVFPAAFDHEVDRLTGQLAETKALPRYLVERMLLDTSGHLESLLSPEEGERMYEELGESRSRLKAAGVAVPAVEAMARYGWVQEVTQGLVRRPQQRPQNWSDRLDRVLTHRVWGSVFFLLLMVLIFQSVFRWAGPAMDWIDGGIGALGGVVEGAMPEGALRSLIVDGVIAGVGGVLVFLPQICILFFFIALLEDCGYMARAAYLMDKLMVRVGLSGKSFIPLLSSFACAVPGIMAARVIENRRDRLTTILVAPLMSCSARLPVYTIMIAAFVPDRTFLGGVLGMQGMTLVAMYLLGTIVAIVVALVLKRTLLRGETPPFVMELPSYKLPSPGMVLYRIAERGWAFVRRAGTLIVAVSVIIWAMLYFPRPAEIAEEFRPRQEQLESELAAAPDGSEAQAQAAEGLAQVEHELAGAYQRQSILGRIGHAIEPAVKPLGWDWRIGSAAVASFPAREVVVATLGIIYNLGGEVDIDNEQGSGQLIGALRGAKWDESGEPVYNLPVALSIMVFFSLCAQCAATLVVIRRETGSWSWPVFTFAYMTGLAYVAALITYQVGMRLGA
jgi:ferrous iron transport protein B